MLWLPKSVTRKGILCNQRPSTRRCTCRIDVIGFPARPSYPLTGIGFSKGSRGVFRYSNIFLAHLVSRRAKAFALELAKAAVLILYPLQDKVHNTVKLLLPINQLKSTFDRSTSFHPKEETSFRVPLFLTLT